MNKVISNFANLKNRPANSRYLIIAAYKNPYGYTATKSGLKDNKAAEDYQFSHKADGVKYILRFDSKNQEVVWSFPLQPTK